MTGYNLSRIRHLIASGIARQMHRGAQLYISVSGHVIANEGFGNSDNDHVMTPETLMLWMSAGKPLTAAAILQCHEKGLLSLDDPMVRFLPEFAIHEKEKITLRHLLTHTAPLRQGDLVPPQSHEAWVRALCRVRMEPGWVPGEKAGYHVGGTWILLGEVVKIVSGCSISRYLEENIFKPLGMNNSCLGINDVEWGRLRNRLVLIYQTERMPPTPHRIWSNPEILRQPRPGSNCIGPMNELGLFYEALLKGGGGILKPETVALMTKRHRIGMPDQTFHHVLDVGLGLIVNSNRYGPETVPYGYGRYATEDTYGHCGNQCSAAFADPRHKLVVALAFNGMPGETAHQARMREVLSAIYEDLNLT